MYEGIIKLQEYVSAEDIKRDILYPYNDTLKNLKTIFIFGTKVLGIETYKYCKQYGLKVKGFIDNNTKIQGEFIEAIKVYSLEEVKKIQGDAWIIIASLNYWGEIEQQLRDNKVENYIHYAILTAYNPIAFPVSNKSLQGIAEDLISNKQQYINMFDRVEDEISKEVLNNILLFRMTFDSKYLSDAYFLSTRGGKEYFDTDIIKLEKQEVFVDGGAYLGETTIEFIKQTNNTYKKVYLFEPDEVLLKQAKDNLREYKNIEYFATGTGSRNEILRFNKTGDTGGCICADGEIEVMISALDEVIKENITFIKLDVEGFERNTLIGAKKLIKINKPKLAISAYHKPCDIWEVCEAVMELIEGYKVYIRHYTRGCFETDLYFINNTRI